MSVDPRTVAAFRFMSVLDQQSGATLEEIAVDPLLHVKYDDHARDRCTCSLNNMFFWRRAFPMHEDRPATRWMEIEYDGQVIFRQPVCEQCRAVEFIKCEIG